MHRNFFALVMLIPVQHYIPLHQQVRLCAVPKHP